MSDDRTAQECYNLCVKHGAKEAFRLEHLRGRSEAFASSAACSATCVTQDPEVTLTILGHEVSSNCEDWTLDLGILYAHVLREGPGRYRWGLEFAASSEWGVTRWCGSLDEAVAALNAEGELLKEALKPWLGDEYNLGSLGEAYNRGRADAIREVRERVVAELRWMAEDSYLVDELHRIIRFLKEFK